MAITGKAFYRSAVHVDTSGPGTQLKALLLTTANALGGEAKLVYMNEIPVDGGPPIAPFAIVAMADRPGGIDEDTNAEYEPVADFYEAGKLGTDGFLAKSFAGLQALVENLYGAAVKDLLQDQDVGSYGEG